MGRPPPQILGALGLCPC